MTWNTTTAAAGPTCCRRGPGTPPATRDLGARDRHRRQSGADRQRRDQRWCRGHQQQHRDPDPLRERCASVRRCASRTPARSYSAAETYATSKTWTLSNNAGTKTVYVQFKDASGNWSAAFTDTIVYDTTAPTISAVAASSITGSSATVTWTTNEAATSRVEYGTTTCLRLVDAARFDAGDGHARGRCRASAAQTTYNYRVRSSDAAGNERIGTNGTLQDARPGQHAADRADRRRGHRGAHPRRSTCRGTPPPTTSGSPATTCSGTAPRSALPRFRPSRTRASPGRRPTRTPCRRATLRETSAPLGGRIGDHAGLRHQRHRRRVSDHGHHRARRWTHRSAHDFPGGVRHDDVVRRSHRRSMRR